MKFYNLILRVKDSTGNEKFLKYRGVAKVRKLVSWLTEKGYTIEFVNVYDNKTKEKLYSSTFKDSIFSN